MLEDEDEDDEEAKVQFFELFCYRPLPIAIIPMDLMQVTTELFN